MTSHLVGTLCLDCPFSTSGHWGRCANAAVNAKVQVSVWTRAVGLLGLYLGGDFLGHATPLCLTFEEASLCFPQRLPHFTFPPGKGLSVSGNMQLFLNGALGA